MPREWPPVSVWLAVLALAGSPAVVAMSYAVAGQWWVATALAGVALVGLTPAVGLLRGWRSGYGLALTYAGFVLVWFGFMLAVCFAAAVAAASVADVLRSPLVAVVAWAAVVLVLLWWPETRRWCGAPAPDGPDEE